jgi:RNA polymerase sigma factor (sigma-70 family)
MPDLRPPELARLLRPQDHASRDVDWSAFTAAYSKLLLHTARSLGGDHDAVMDRYTYVLEQLRRDDFQRLRSYAADGRSKFTTWLVVVARRLCLDQHRQRYGRDRPAPEAGARAEEERTARRNLSDLVGAEVEPDTLRSDSTDPERELCATELRSALELALEALEPRDRLLLRLRFDDGLAAAEIARIMDFPTPFHVYRRLDHVFAALRRALRRSGVEDSVP